jgi:predicted enzyme related to lactoylglutathione lyase
MQNIFVHSELQSSNPAKSREFYSQLFNWEFEDMPNMPYSMVNMGEDEVSIGLTETACPQKSTFWINYILVEDIHASSQKAQFLGAQLIQDVQEVPNMGKFCWLQDPQGATLALWQKAS